MVGKKPPQSKPLSKKVVKSIREQKTLMGKLGAFASGKAGQFKEHVKDTLTGGASTKGGIAMHLLGAHGAKRYYETFFGKSKVGGDSGDDIDEVKEAITDTAVKQGRMLQSIRDVVKSHTAKLKGIEGNLGIIAEDVSDIKALLMPKVVIATGKRGGPRAGEERAAAFNPMAPAGAQFNEITTTGKLLARGPGKEFQDSATQKAALATATLALKIAKKDQERAEIRKKNQWRDPKEVARRGDPIAILRQECHDNFQKVFAMLEDLKKGMEKIEDGGGIMEGLGKLAALRALTRRGGRGRVKGRGAGRGKGPISEKAKGRYERRFGKKAAAEKFGKPKKAGGGIGVGGLVGGGLAYAAVDSMRDDTLVSQDAGDLKQQAIEAKASGDAEKLKQLDTQVKAQKKDVKIQAAATGAAVGGAVAGQAASNKIWKLFVNFVKRRAPKLAAKIGARLASAGVMATVPVIGWIGTAVTLGFTAWMAWDLYQLWKEFSALSEAEKETFTDEIQKLEATKDKAGAKPSGATIPAYVPGSSGGPTSRGGRRRGTAGAMTTTPAAPVAGGGKFGGAGASGSWSEPTGTIQRKPTGSSKGLTMPDASIKEIIEKAANRVGVDVGIMMAMAKQESSFNPNAKAKTSSAKGLYQFLDGTWNDMVKKYGSSYPELSKGAWDPMASAIAGALFIKDNSRILQKAGIPIDGTSVYAAHFLGPGGARTLFSANPATNAVELMPKPAAANKHIFYNKDGSPRTVGEVQNALFEKVGKFADMYSDKLQGEKSGTMLASTKGSGGSAPAAKSSVAPSKTIPAGAVESESRQMQASNRPSQAAPVVVNAPTVNNTKVASTGPKPTQTKASAVSQDDSLIRMSGRDAQHPVLA